MEENNGYLALIFFIIFIFILKKPNKFKIVFNNNLNRKNIFIISNEKKFKRYSDIINFEDSDSVYKFFNKIDLDQDLHLIIITEGGESENPDVISYQISQLKDFGYKNKVNVYIPSFAMSSGSMMMLAADNIYMDWYSGTSPVDTQIEYEMEETESFSVKHLKEIKTKGEFKERYSELIKKDAESIYFTDVYMLKRILKNNINKNKIIRHIFDTKLSHGMTFNHIDLKNMGLNIITPIPENIRKISDKLINL
tara:strand:+ start:2170 stop:2925 length:756 start_codon:yes stop_codon:yes gene_type:complete